MKHTILMAIDVQAETVKKASEAIDAILKQYLGKSKITGYEVVGSNPRI